MALSAVTFSFISVSCQSTSKKSVASPPKDYIPAASINLPISGSSQKAQYSPSGQKISYEKQTAPGKSDIYLFELGTQQEKKLTYNKSYNTSPSFSDDGQWIFYASNTDELKEMAPSQLVKSKDNSQSLIEIYKINLDTLAIKRITYRPGFDGDPKQFDSKLYYTSKEKNKSKIMQFPKGIINYGINGSASLSNGKIAWVRTSSDNLTSQILTSEINRLRAKPIIQGEGLNRSPNWHPSGQLIIFSSNQNKSKNFELYIAQPDGSCLQRLTYSLGDDLWPQFHPNGSEILFTYKDEKGQFLLKTMPFSPPKACQQVNP